MSQLAHQNRSIRTIQTELEFLRETSLLSATDVTNILSLLPALPSTRPSSPSAPVSPPRSPSASTNATRATPLPSGATPAFGAPATPAFGAPATPASQRPQSAVAHVQALWPYPGPGQIAAQGDLCFQAGDAIEVIEKSNADWWVGRKGSEQGHFPAGYVREIERRQAPLPPTSALGRKQWALGSGLREQMFLS